MSKMIDMTGWDMKEHGIPDSKIIVIKRDQNTADGKAKWLCQCECGKQFVATGKNIRNGNTKSCGCLQRYKASQTHGYDLKGQTFGLLKVLSENVDIKYQNRKKQKYWNCQCECGTITVVSTDNLIRKNTQSCGCLKSKGELKIVQLLTENNITFEKEKIFDNFIYEDTKHFPRFDFFIENKYLIEYDGIQHFLQVGEGTGYMTDDKIKKIQDHDSFKNQWCKEHNIPLIRIPYTRLDNLSITDLRLETSEFIV